MPLSNGWAQLAFDPPRGSGAALGSGILRAEIDDFVVEEQLGFAPAGQGQHVLLKVRKRDANTEWVARALANLSRCRAMDVGYAGLKDRRAVAVQWFSVPKSAVSLDEWIGVHRPEFEVLEAHAHTRKLPRGALEANRFVIRIRDVLADDDSIAARVDSIRRRGVPNYFGAQRFGHEGSNLTRLEGLTEGLRELRQQERGFVLSAARSLIFNAVLAERVRQGNWELLQTGDIVGLDGRGSIFPADSVDDVLRERCAGLDVHPTGPMWGAGWPSTQGSIFELETRIGAELPSACALVAEAAMKQERRPLRLAVRELEWARDNGDVVLRFQLTKGSFATTVLREMFESIAA